MKTDFAMAIHFHQPVGNFDNIMERACDKCYIPFLEVLRKYPDIKMTFHFTGCLLEWVEKGRPEMIELIKAMVKTGRVEVMSGGFYEPILSSIPLRDRTGQIAMLNDYVRTKFSFEPKGAWIAERVWEPELPSVLHDAGIKYVILDETHFLYSGITKDRTYGYYITEDNSKPVAVFPSDKVLRYYMPFRMPEESIQYMQQVLKENPGATFIYGDDGEKFGEWPGTHKWVFEEKWLEKFFDSLMQNSDWIRTSTLSECLEKKPPLGKVYIPTTSYEEMMEWALPADTQERFEDVLEDIKSSGKEEYYRPFIRGGFWRNFFAKYPESDHMNKKMIFVSEKLENARSKKNKDLLSKAEKDLFRGQCNCAYWHGVFGGLYLFHLRRAVYHHLIKSEASIDSLRYGKRQFCKANILDLDADGSDEVILENRKLSLYVDPAEGGALKELDSKAICQNFTNTLARRKEAYHRRIIDRIKEGGPEDPSQIKTIHDRIQEVSAGIEEHLVYDDYGRYNLIDHFFDSGTGIEEFQKRAYSEKGDFVNGVYDFAVKKRIGGVLLEMKRTGSVGGIRLELKKEIELPKKGSYVQVKYSLRNADDNSLESIFAPEFNLTMPDADSERYKLVFGRDEETHDLADLAQHEGSDRVKITDAKKELSVEMEFNRKCRLWHVPIKTASQSEKAYELNYQGSTVLPLIPVGLKPGEEAKFSFRITINIS